MNEQKNGGGGGGGEGAIFITIKEEGEGAEDFLLIVFNKITYGIVILMCLHGCSSKSVEKPLLCFCVTQIVYYRYQVLRECTRRGNH